MSGPEKIRKEFLEIVEGSRIFYFRFEGSNRKLRETLDRNKTVVKVVGCEGNTKSRKVTLETRKKE